VLIAGIVGYFAALLAYPRHFPPISLWTGLSLLGVAVAIAVTVSRRVTPREGVHVLTMRC
jgi:uncharacterized membrane protein YczE